MYSLAEGGFEGAGLLVVGNRLLLILKPCTDPSSTH
jgi:hypothetical protein